MADPSGGAAAGNASTGGQQLPPDFFDPVPFSNHRGTILGICITLMTLCWLAIIARMSSRFFVTKNPGWDDFFVIWAAAMVSMGTVAFMVATNSGMGDHIYLLSRSDIRTVLLCNYLFGASYNCSTALIKISLLFQYLRVFERNTWTYRFTQGLTVFMMLWGFAFGFIAWFSCLPKPSALWNMTGEGHCYGAASSNMNEVVRVITAHAGINFALDIIVLGLAFRLLFVKERPTTKTGMSVLLFVGCVSCMFAAWRLADIVQTDAGRSSDLSWDLPGPTLLSICEIYIACFCASIPFFWPMIKQSINAIFVKYEFSVSTESRFHDNDDELELAPSKSGMRTHATDGGSLDSKSRSDLEHQTAHYADDYIRAQGDPFAAEYRTETAVKTENFAGGKKSTFVRFKK